MGRVRSTKYGGCFIVPVESIALQLMLSLEPNVLVCALTKQNRLKIANVVVAHRHQPCEARL